MLYITVLILLDIDTFPEQYQVMGVKSVGSQNFFYFCDTYASSPKCMRHQRQRHSKQQRRRTITQVHKTSHCSLPFLLTSSLYLFRLFPLLDDEQSFFHLTLKLKPERQNVLIQRTSTSQYECRFIPFSVIFNSLSLCFEKSCKISIF